MSATFELGFENTVDASGVEIRLDESDQTLTVDADDLRAGGWIRDDEASDHCGEEHCGTSDCECGDVDDLLVDVRHIVERWHDLTHDGVYRVCYEQPCKDLLEVFDDAL